MMDGIDDLLESHLTALQEIEKEKLKGEGEVVPGWRFSVENYPTIRSPGP
jgi:hypothetical protein